MPNGQVLLVGGSASLAGWPPIALASAELYNPSTGKWTTTGSLSIGRFSHMATLLQSGQVLVVGGECNSGARNCSSGYTPSSELYDSSTGKWTTTGSLIVTRYGFEATSLQNGKVLVAGGNAATGGLLAH